MVCRNLLIAVGEKSTSQKLTISFLAVSGLNCMPTGFCIHALATSIHNAEIFAPIAYSNVPAIDPFNTLEGSRTSTFADKEYFYLNYDETCGWPGTIVDWVLENVPTAPQNSLYLLASQGPDNLSEIQDRKISPIFDVTNGLTSQGDIIIFGP